MGINRNDSCKDCRMTDMAMWPSTIIGHRGYKLAKLPYYTSAVASGAAEGFPQNADAASDSTHLYRGVPQPLHLYTPSCDAKAGQQSEAGRAELGSSHRPCH